MSVSTWSIAARGGKPILQVGATGQEVVELQKLLAHWQIYSAALTGVFDRSLETAVKRFQGQVFLKETGIVDRRTWQALYQGSPIDMPVLQRGGSGEAVKLLQQSLTVTKDYFGAIDGSFGQKTEQAVRSFQRRQGLIADGIVSPCTWRALGKTRY
ncbi:peptidoglycan-binding domain-containing protein [Pantanalinema rosaneae CENA516]|uniref:peptidoglycan-binding domain-containing protein n=1 Tax=Pantanalinema rosaneae TaxID=1620701 RepID=UPI003D6ED0BF